MEKKQQNTVLRFIAIFIVMVVGFVAVMVQIIVIQTKERDQWLKIAKQQEAVQKAIPPMRGNIYDCNGNLLAGSLPRYELIMDTRVPALHAKDGKLFKEYIDSISTGLSEIFGDQSPAEYKQMITQAYRRKEGRLALYPTDVSFIQMQAVKKLPLFCKGKYKSGLIVTPRHVRVKPYGSLASRTIGQILASSGKPSCGIELEYDKLLQGKPGVSQSMQINGHKEDVEIQKPEDGYDLITTIDATLQDIVESNLRALVNERTPEWGCCIMMEVSTGEIKAISNLQRTKSGNYEEDKNNALIRVEPGSTFKTISLMAALDEGKVELTDTFYTQSTPWIYKGHAKHVDAHKMDGPLTVRQALAVSSNIVFAKMTTQSFDGDGKKFVNKLKKIGVCDGFKFDIPGLQDPRIEVPKDAVTISKMAYGYSVEMSPLQILTFYNAIANDGKMVAPFVVKEIQKDGQTTKSFTTEVINSHICKASTLRDVRTALHDVVWDNEFGTAARGKAQSRIVEIAGKTGTAQILEGGHYTSQRHRIAFVGFFPYDNPQYTCICVLHDPKRSETSSYDAGRDCGGAVRRIAEKTMAIAGTRAAREMATEYDSIQKPTIKGGKQKEMRRAAEESGIRVRSTDGDWARVDENMQAQGVTISSNSVPNVVGMGARDAVYAIEQTGMQARISGKGRVVKQSLAAGSNIVKNGIIYLELR